MRKLSKLAAIAAGAVLVAVGAAAPAHAGVEPRIINGSTATISDAPFITAINVPDGSTGYGYDGKPDNWCGGSLISANKVLTAAHCVKGQAASKFTLSIGSTSRTGGKVAKVSKIWVHPNYSSSTYVNDVAVLTLDRQVSNAVATLNTTSANEQTGLSAKVVGWGVTESGNSVNALRKVSVPLVSDATCGASYSGFVNSAMLCAGLKAGGKDSCSGDSGGPLIVNGRLTGIVSFGEGCALPNKYGVYTQVSTYVPLIQQQLRA